MAARVGVTFRSEEKLGPYLAALRCVGLEPVPLAPPGPHRLEDVDALLLSGGTDLDPALYGQSRHPETDPEPDRARDHMEMLLCRQALERNLPLLAICRGMQLLNVACGGDLIQHVSNAAMHRQKGVFEAHKVHIVAGTLLRDILGEASFSVNSRHHQAVGRLGEGLRAAAQAEDGTIEAIECPGRRFALAVQWHPEDRVPAHALDTRIFEAFRRSIVP